MTVKLFKKNPLLFLYLAGVLLLVMAAWFWCFKLSVDPKRVFWSTFSHGLAVNGITIQGEQTTNGTSAKQTIQYSFGARNIAHGTTELKQGTTTVTTETLGLQNVDYVRYLGIKTDQKKADGSKIDPSKVLNVWAKGQEGQGQFFSQAVFGTSLPLGGIGFPIGQVSPEQRQQLVKEAQSNAVYTINFKTVKKQRVHGRLLYTYEASIEPPAYVALLKHFATDLNLHTFDTLNPSDYKGQPAFKVTITVDARAREVRSIAAVGNDAHETYSSYGIPVSLDVPAQTIDTAELQKRLSNLQ